MDLIDRLRERIRREFGIETPEQLKKAVEELDLDLGIFVKRPEGANGKDAV